MRFARVSGILAVVFVGLARALPMPADAASAAVAAPVDETDVVDVPPAWKPATGSAPRLAPDWRRNEDLGAVVANLSKRSVVRAAEEAGVVPPPWKREIEVAGPNAPSW